jgi:hypothetical protein
MGEAVRAVAVAETPDRVLASPPPPRRSRRGRTARSKMRRGYADKMRRPAEDKSMGWDTYGSAPA